MEGKIIYEFALKNAEIPWLLSIKDEGDVKIEENLENILNFIEYSNLSQLDDLHLDASLIKKEQCTPEDNLDILTCELCEKKFLKEEDLNQHVETHIHVNLLECNICKKSFTQVNYLRMHMQSHMKEKVYKCQVCDQQFSFLGNYNR